MLSSLTAFSIDAQYSDQKLRLLNGLKNGRVFSPLFFSPLLFAYEFGSAISLFNNLIRLYRVSQDVVATGGKCMLLKWVNGKPPSSSVSESSELGLRLVQRRIVAYIMNILLRVNNSKEILVLKISFCILLCVFTAFQLFVAAVLFSPIFFL